jgi:hypothetical protein
MKESSDDGRAKNRVGDAASRDRRFGLALAAQVVARAALGIGFQRAHLQQSRDAARAARAHELLGEGDVGVREPRAVVTPLVEYSDQVDRRVAAAQQTRERRLVVHVGLDELDARLHQQRAAARA